MAAAASGASGASRGDVARRSVCLDVTPAWPFSDVDLASPWSSDVGPVLGRRPSRKKGGRKEEDEVGVVAGLRTVTRSRCVAESGANHSPLSLAFYRAASIVFVGRLENNTKETWPVDRLSYLLEKRAR